MPRILGIIKRLSPRPGIWHRAPLSSQIRSDVRHVVGHRTVLQHVVDLHAVLGERDPNELRVKLRVPARTNAHFEVLRVETELHGRQIESKDRLDIQRVQISPSISQHSNKQKLTLNENTSRGSSLTFAKRTCSVRRDNSRQC